MVLLYFLQQQQKIMLNFLKFIIKIKYIDQVLNAISISKLLAIVKY